METDMNDGNRDEKGQFVKGHAGGPGRPRRVVEATYMRALRDAMSPEDFGRVVAKALEQALQGDSTARAWLGRYALGADPPSLLRLAAVEAAGEGEEHLVADACDAYQRSTSLRGLTS